jgi:hypothetical protein
VQPDSARDLGCARSARRRAAEQPDDDGTDFPITVQLEDSQSAAFGNGSIQVFQTQAVLRTRKPAPAADPAPVTKKKSVKCISKKTFKKKFKGKTKCPKGWVKI